MNTNGYLQLMRFPPEWQQWHMVPDESYINEHIHALKPGMEHAPEHCRHEAFHFWLARNPSTERLTCLTRLSFLDPDTTMGESVRAEILQFKNCDRHLRALITNGPDQAAIRSG